MIKNENSSSASAETTPAEASAETTTSGAVADPETGACAPGTLHDFVSSLINDEAAKAAYLADPLGALGAAGLEGLTPADVQEVLPLVADSLPTDLAALPVDGLPAVSDLSGALPVDGLPALGGLTGALPVDGLPAVDGLAGALPVDGLPALGDLSGALPVDGLPAVGGLAGALPVDGLPSLGDLPLDLPTGGLPDVGALPALGGLPVSGLPVALPALGDLGDLPNSLPTGVPSLGDLPLVSDLPALPTLDTPLGDVTAAVGNAAAAADLNGEVLATAASGFLSNPEDSDAPTVSAAASSAFGDFAAGGKIDPEEFGGSVAGSSPLADFGAGAVGHVGGDFGAWAGADTVAGDLAGGVLAGPDGVQIAAESPLGSVNLNSNGDFSIQPADTADLLDVDHLGTTGDVVAGTVAHYVNSGADVLASGVAAGGDSLGGYLTGSLGTVGDTVESTTDTVTDGIHQGGDLVSEHLTNLPTTDDLPLDQLPELPQLPDLPDVDSHNLPAVGDVTSHLPVSLDQLPVDTGAVTGLVSNNPVTDVVHDSPVGGLVSGVTDHLPQADHLPLVGDLDLGL